MAIDRISVESVVGQMAMIEDGRTCREDDDCSRTQYCYMSGICVNYTQCSRYNREEGTKPSRDPSQCGDCLPGHTAEMLGTGKMEILCKKTSPPVDPNESIGFGNAVITSCVIGAVIILSVIGVLMFLWKKRIFFRQQLKCLPWMGNPNVSQPTAPPPPVESSPFIAVGGITNEAHSYNKLKNKNLLVCATPYREPNWVRVNPNYENNLSEDDLNTTEDSHSSAQLQPINNSDLWHPDQLAIEIGTASLSEYGVEQRDNTMNAALVQQNSPNAENDNQGEDHNSSQSSSGHNMDGNEGDSESNDSQNRRERMRASNILISQRISMNINLVNND